MSFKKINKTKLIKKMQHQHLSKDFRLRAVEQEVTRS